MSDRVVSDIQTRAKAKSCISGTTQTRKTLQFCGPISELILKIHLI